MQRVRAYRSFDNATNTQQAFENGLTMARSNILEDQYGDISAGAVQVNDIVLDALYAGPDANGAYAERFPFTTAFPPTELLATQLRSVAMMIAARQALGVKRQIFFVSLGGFDHHSDQLATTPGNPAPGPGDPGGPVR